MEAPATIKHLREDLVLAKSKMKAYSSQIGEDSRFIRSLNDEKAKQKEQIVHLTTLVNSKNLEEREVLYDKLDKSNQKVTELQKLYSEAEKRLEMIDKTLSTDNKYLRARIHTMEKELKELQNQAKEMNESLKEKDKVVASLSIYRYNALHKKHESPPPCKVCIEREQIELERSRIAAIKAKIPILEIECIKVTRGDSVSVHLKDTLPNAELDSFTLNYSEDPSLEEKLQTKHVKVKNGHEIEIPNVAVNSLKNGVTYYFRVVAANGDIEGKPSKMHEVVVGKSINSTSQIVHLSNQT